MMRTLSMHDPLHHEPWNECESRYIVPAQEPMDHGPDNHQEKRNVQDNMNLWRKKAHEVGVQARTIGGIKAAVEKGERNHRAYP